MSKVAFSIIVPCFNVEDTIIRCLDSIVSQSFNNFEIILVDDGSTDRTPQIIEEFTRGKSQFKILTQANGGLANARNTGLSFALGEYVWFVDSDDYVDLNFLNELYSIAIEHNLDFIESDFYFYWSDKKIRKANIFGDNTTDRIMSGIEYITSIASGKNYWSTVWKAIFRREIIIRNNLGFEPGIYFEDVLFVNNFLNHSNRTSFLTKPLYYYVQTQNSIIRGRGSEKVYKRWRDNYFVLERIIANNEKIPVEKVIPLVKIANGLHPIFIFKSKEYRQFTGKIWHRLSFKQKVITIFSWFRLEVLRKLRIVKKIVFS